MKNKTILIVEDDNIIAFELQYRLEENGYNVVGPFAYGEDVIENICSMNVDLILMDINLKGNLDGIETAQIIKQKCKIPIIYLTAYTDQNTLNRAKITEPFGYVIKPFDERELFTNIEMSLFKHCMELKLLESEGWLHTTLKSIGDGVIATDINSNIKFMNKVAANLTGWCVEESIDRKLDEIFRIISEIDREPAYNPVERVIKEGIVLSLANHSLLINKDGREISITDSASPIKDDDGIVIGCVLVFQDQSEKRKFQQEIEDSEAKYRTTLESLDDGIYVIDKNLNVLLMNNTFINWAGKLGISNLINFGGTKLIDIKPFISERIISEINRSFETFEPSIIEEDYSYNGFKLYTETKRIPIYIKDNDPKLVTIIRNKTESKLADEDLKASEERYRLLHQSMTDCFVQVSMSSQIIEANRSYLEMLNYNKDELIQLKYTDITPQKWHAFEEKIVETQIIPKGYSEIYEKEYIKKDGSVFPVEMRTYLLNDKEGKPSGMWAIVRDITERKRIDADIKQKNKELSHLNSSKDKFFSIIAHDLRGPFSTLLGLSKILAEEFQDLDSNDMQELSKNLQKSALNLYELLENLLVWSRAQSGGIVINPEKCNLYYLVKHNIDIHFETAKKKQILLINNIEDGLTVFSDVPSVNTILRNLISNAIKFTSRGGKIEVGTTKFANEKTYPFQTMIDEESVVIYVKDNGIGLNADTMDKLFKIEYKISRPGTDMEPSTGLGLLLCKEYVEKNGGKIWVVSEEGKGSTFYFSLIKDK
jgi:PAS domain S-box-containing protein